MKRRKDSEDMAVPALLPIKLLGWAAVGLALGAGWKLGTYVVEKAAGDPRMTDLMERMKGRCAGQETPLWKRRFSRFSE
ncbi:MAG: hypothetical protein RDU20_16645 [Desulfomonilaceae bacterium]|nr:hypothetical protein [Desulfomonilaceae bacterium]